jgi:hypothetical protein
MRMVVVRVLSTVASLVLMAACNPPTAEDIRRSDVTSTTLASTTLARPQSTTTAPVTSSTTTADTTTVAPSTTIPPRLGTTDVGLLVVHATGIDLRFGDDDIAVVEGVEAKVAFADGLGGVVYQPAPSDLERPWWDWWGDLPEPVLVWPSGAPIEHPIMWMPTLGSAPLVLVPDDGETWIELIDVTTLRDRPVVVYEREVSLPDSCVGLDDITFCYFESLRTRLTARDLLTGEESSLGCSGGFEWRTRAAVAGSRVIVGLSDPDHGLPAAICSVDVSTRLALDRDESITSACDGAAIIAADDPCAASGRCDADPGSSSLSAPAISRDGSSLAFLEYYIDCCDRPSNDTELVVWDLDTGRETLRLHLGQNQWARWIDHNGSETLIGLDSDDVILIDADGIATMLPPGPLYTLWDQ